MFPLPCSIYFRKFCIIISVGSDVYFPLALLYIFQERIKPNIFKNKSVFQGLPFKNAIFENTILGTSVFEEFVVITNDL